MKKISRIAMVSLMACSMMMTSLHGKVDNGMRSVYVSCAAIGGYFLGKCIGPWAGAIGGAYAVYQLTGGNPRATDKVTQAVGAVREKSLKIAQNIKDKADQKTDELLDVLENAKSDKKK